MPSEGPPSPPPSPLPPPPSPRPPAPKPELTRCLPHLQILGTLLACLGERCSRTSAPVGSFRSVRARASTVGTVGTVSIRTAELFQSPVALGHSGDVPRTAWIHRRVKRALRQRLWSKGNSGREQSTKRERAEQGNLSHGDNPFVERNTSPPPPGLVHLPLQLLFSQSQASFTVRGQTGRVGLRLPEAKPAFKHLQTKSGEGHRHTKPHRHRGTPFM